MNQKTLLSHMLLMRETAGCSLVMRGYADNSETAKSFEALCRRGLATEGPQIGDWISGCLTPKGCSAAREATGEGEK